MGSDFFPLQDLAALLVIPSPSPPCPLEWASALG
jgi:hypothetical protein